MLLDFSGRVVWHYVSKLAGCCAGYPEAYFARLPLPTDAVMAVVSACRTDDIYNQVRFTRPSAFEQRLAWTCCGAYCMLISESLRMQAPCVIRV